MSESQTTASGDRQSLLLFQLGPVQEFIAQARSTRDLWSGSYLLSWLMAHAIKAVVTEGQLHDNAVVFPSLQGAANPLVLALRNRRVPINPEQALTPNIPNRFMVVVPEQRAKALAQTAEAAVKHELRTIGESVWSLLQTNKYQLEATYRPRWDYQVGAFPQCAWAYVPLTGADTWQEAFANVNQALAARRNTRDFEQWISCPDETKKKEAVNSNLSLLKDSLSGKEEVIGSESFWKRLKENSLFDKASGHSYGAMNLIKRLWLHIDDQETSANYLANALSFFERDVFKTLKVASIPAIAAKNEKGDYVAVLAMDGDKMGEKITANSSSPQALQKFSATLADFALNRVRGTVEENGGMLVYAGGDDVLALLPASQAIACATTLRDAFKSVGNEFGFEASCGIAVGHQNAPLQMLVKEAQKAEKRAKGIYDRAALAINVYKRSGEIIEWGCKWESGALELMAEVTRLSNEEKLSGRFPYALAALLQPYALEESDHEALAAMRSVIEKEVEHVLSRQGAELKGEREPLLEKINAWLASCLLSPESNSGDSRPKTQDPETEKPDLRPQDFINLFLVETFMNRMRGDN